MSSGFPVFNPAHLAAWCKDWTQFLKNIPLLFVPFHGAGDRMKCSMNNSFFTDPIPENSILNRIFHGVIRLKD